jgi:very-short-patch-repair endonuclease
MGDRLPSFDIDARLRAIGSQQLGLVTAAQANEAGVDKHALARRRDSGGLVTVYPSVMRLGAAPESDAQRFLAASLFVPGSIVAATSAATIHGMPLPGSLVDDRPVLCVGRQQVIRVHGIRTMRVQLPPQHRRWMSSLIASPAATLLQLPRMLDAASVERCLDHALAHRLVTVTGLTDLLSLTQPGAVFRRTLLLDLVAARSGGIGHRSKLEQLVAKWMRSAGIEGWKRNHQVDVGRGRSVEVDFAWPDLKIALEISPFFTHGSRRQQDRDARRRRLLVQAGWRVIEATDPDLTNQLAFATTIALLRTLIGT